ncbi:hypothetical protein RE411_21785 [Agrobacterium pusense]|uniref:hypothetical protein n=1 Tax=Agrobacterium pusense TaxID=648995 RepID=UPI0028682727|nr:hypothetical protein [Agrobacterium pusense]WMW58580.1 hypothetical protein RE411_21785 [Agrobacterium pusense]
MKIDWHYIQKYWDWLDHIVEGLVMSAIITVIFLFAVPFKVAALIGLAFSICHFHGRQTRNYERSVNMKPPHLKGYLMWRWNISDFRPTAIVLLIGMLIAPM